jgi:phage-related protein
MTPASQFVTSPPLQQLQLTPAQGVAKGVTSAVGNTVSGVSNTVGGVVGAVGRGLGETVTGATGGLGRPVGDSLAAVGDGVQVATADLAKGARHAGQWKT